MRKIWIYGIVAVVAIIVAAGILTSLNHGGGAISTAGPNIFTGRIVSGSLAFGDHVNGTVLSDNGCTIDPRTGLSNCTTTIQTPNGMLAFNYEHDMMEKPCLSYGDKVAMQMLENGTAVVKRNYWAGGGA